MAKLYLPLTVILLLATFTHQENEVGVSKSARNGDLNMYLTYTRDNPRENIRVLPTAASVAAFRNFRTKTVILIHDHLGSGSTTAMTTLKDAFLASEDVSIVIVDWTLVADGSYVNAAGAVSSVGAGVADLLRFLIQYNKANVARVHFVGFGLGAHVAAFAARATTGNVARITALDPSASQFGSNSDRLRLSDAAYVEVIHTDTEDSLEESAIGIRDAIGHVDFYPNGGTTQLGCGNDHECNHKRAWELFAASLTHDNLVGNQCDDEAEPVEANCHGYTLPVGNNELVKYGSGVFYLETGRTYPYNVALNCLLPCIVS